MTEITFKQDVLCELVTKSNSFFKIYGKAGV